MDSLLFPLITTVISSLIALITSLLVVKARLREEQKISLSNTVEKYSHPILLSASDLHDRLWHLTQTQAKAKNPILLAEDNLEMGNRWRMTRKHYLTSTIFLFARYFAWIEILHQEIQFLKFGSNKTTKEFGERIKACERALASTSYEYFDATKIHTDRPLFQFQQVLIGQLMIKQLSDSPISVNYSEFVDKYHSELQTHEDFLALEELITRSVSKIENDFCLIRCCQFLNSLVDLIDFLDPKYEFIQKKIRERVLIPKWATNE